MGWNEGAVAFNVVPFVPSTWPLAAVATGAILGILCDFWFLKFCVLKVWRAKEFDRFIIEI